MGFVLCYRCLQRRNTKAKPAIKRKIKTVNNKKSRKTPNGFSAFLLKFY